MSLKRVVLVAAMAVLVLPAAALADGLNFGFSTATGNGNNLFISRSTGSFVLGSTASTVGTVTLTYISRMLGPVPFGPSAPPTFGTPPTFAFPGTLVTDNFGTVSFTTGLLSSFVGLSSATFGAGGSVVITSGGTFDTATGNAIANGTTIFSGAFSGLTTMTQFIGGGYPGCQPTVKYCYELAGPVSGTIDPAILSLFGLGNNPGATGFILSLAIGFNDTTAIDNLGSIEAGAASVVVPEPGTLALFGTGLIAVAGFIRRRIKA